MIHSTDVLMATEPKKRVNRATLDPTIAALLESQDDLRDGVLREIGAFREELAGFRKIGWALLGGFFILQIVQIVIFAQLLGVDVRETAAATREIVSAAPHGDPTVAPTDETPIIPLDTDGDN